MAWMDAQEIRCYSVGRVVRSMISECKFMGVCMETFTESFTSNQ